MVDNSPSLVISHAVREQIRAPRTWISTIFSVYGLPKVGYLQRTEDVSGVSGTGNVASVVRYPDGKCVLYWTASEIHQLEIFNSVDDILAIHGHGGKTTVVWI